LLCGQRKLFFPTPIDNNSANHKTNIHEAKLVAQVVQQFQNIFLTNKLPFGKQTIGIITPFRAQIATIRHELSSQRSIGFQHSSEQNDFDPDQITIDTVERYQGGARDIIIISLCTNKESQLAAISSFSKDGKVDRKLNVALTRARKHLVILGNAEILNTNPIYRALIEDCTSKVH
jgi:DNA replication ATP-dependent helicase Dna2